MDLRAQHAQIDTRRVAQTRALLTRCTENELQTLRELEQRGAARKTVLPLIDAALDAVRTRKSDPFPGFSDLKVGRRTANRDRVYAVEQRELLEKALHAEGEGAARAEIIALLEQTLRIVRGEAAPSDGRWPAAAPDWVRSAPPQWRKLSPSTRAANRRLLAELPAPALQALYKYEVDRANRTIVRRQIAEALEACGHPLPRPSGYLDVDSFEEAQAAEPAPEKLWVASAPLADLVRRWLREDETRSQRGLAKGADLHPRMLDKLLRQEDPLFPFSAACALTDAAGLDDALTGLDTFCAA